MKQEPNNEVDLLLRRLGRRDDATAPEADHLDADELSAFAENALPAAARARYTSHLAECSRCRQFVVQLSSSVGVVAASETAKVAGPSRWKSFLASLFTPMVLRYAAPALGLIVVAAIGFVVLRREQQDQFVTQVTNNEPRTAALPPAEPGATTLNGDAKESQSRAEGLVEKQKNQQPAAPAPAPNSPPVVTNVESDVSKDKAAAPKPNQQTAVANEAPPPPKAEPSATPEEKPAETEVSKKEVRDFRAPAPSSQTTLQAAEREERKTHGFVRDKATDEVSAAGAGSVAKVKRADISANTRSVGGRRFQKKGGVWIDTAYDSSGDYVSISRGSEQYRALVADEPAIKTIADELDGEIIVVWKARTYRIRP